MGRGRIEKKLWGIISNQGAFKKHLFLCAKHRFRVLSILGTMVTSKLLAATEYCNFYEIVIPLSPIIFKIN